MAAPAPAQEGSMENYVKHWDIYRVIVWDAVRRGQIRCLMCRKFYLPNEIVSFHLCEVPEGEGNTKLRFYHRQCLSPERLCVSISAIPPSDIIPSGWFVQPVDPVATKCAVCLEELDMTTEKYWYNEDCGHICHRWRCNPRSKTILDVLEGYPANPNKRSLFCPSSGCTSPVANFILLPARIPEDVFKMDEEIEDYA